jgi:hypothetical protein
LWLDRLRDRGDAVLEVPAEHDLCGCLAVPRGELDDGRVLERILDRVRVGRAVAVDAAERRPGLRNDAFGGVEVTKRLLGEKRVQLDLVDGRRDARLADQVLEMAFAEVRGADRAGAAVRQHLLNRVVRGDGAVEVARAAVVEQEEVDVVEAKSA